MINLITMNKDKQKTARPVRNRKEYVALRNIATNVKNFELARAGDSKAKAKLRQFNYNALITNGVLRGCRHVASTFSHDIDCGDEQLCRQTAEKILAKKEEIGLLELSISSGWGLHAICRRAPGKTILENQVRLAQITQTEMDTNAHDLQRVMYTGPATPDTLLYLDDAIFDEPLSIEESAREYEQLKEREKRGEEEVPPEAKKANKHFVPAEETNTNLTNLTNGCAQEKDSCNSCVPAVASEQSSSACNSCSEKKFKGVPYSQIIDEWWKQNGGVPAEGERNVKLYQLAVNLRAICDNDKALLLGIMPRLGLDEQELRSIVDSACKEPPKGIGKMLNRILSDKGVVNSEKSAAANGEHDMEAQLEMWGEQIEAMMPAYPILRDICKGLKRRQYPAAMFVAGGLMMTLMTRCTYRFYHRPEELRRLNNSTLIIGDPASGKSFATRLYKLLAEPIIKADQMGKDAINAYREEMRTKGANKEKPKKPKVVVRVHPARTSNAQFIQDMVNAKEVVDNEEMQLHMLTFDTELDNTVTVQRGGSWIDKQSLELKAFHNEEDGQAYSNNDSILQDFCVFWNYIYTGTPIALKKKVNEQNFGSGLATRLTCIPLPVTKFKMLDREQHVDYESDARLKEWAYKLDKTKGELSLQKIVDELYDWTARRMMDAEENDSRADEMLLKRCAYHGLNFSAPFIVMRHWEDMKEDGMFYCGTFETDETDWQLAELIVNIQYACQRFFFGALAEHYFDNKMKEASINVQRRQKTFDSFARLPEEFMAEDVMRCFGFSTIGAARSRIARLQNDRLIEKSGEKKEGGQTKSIFRKTGVMML